jgi:hypothetical protein
MFVLEQDAVAKKLEFAASNAPRAQSEGRGSLRARTDIRLFAGEIGIDIDPGQASFDSVVIARPQRCRIVEGTEHQRHLK